MYLLNVITSENFYNHYKYGWIILNEKSILFSYQGKGKLGNCLLAVAKYYAYKNNIPGKEINIKAFITMLSGLFKTKVTVYVAQLAKMKV